MSEIRYTGKGIGVAVLDTGIFPHVDFDGRIWAFYDFLSYRRLPYDDNGHGTHVSGIIAGSGKTSGGKYRGMAPECGIIALKVLDRYGNGNKEDVIRALSWIRSHREKYRIRVVNISVGTTCRTKGDQDLLLKGVDDLWDEGLNIVAAAGNLGPAPGSVTAPGSSKKVITVGSSDMLEGRIGVSGRGPTAECVCKPDIVAPGNRITSCIPGYPCTYGQKSGTSMSTPLISGAIACMLEKNPDLSNLEIKKRLMDSAEDLGFPQNQQGWGQFDCQRFFSL